MKTILSIFLAVFTSLSLFTQNYMADEFIVEYIPNATAIEKQAVRNLYGISNTTIIGENIELWSAISFPLTVSENGITTAINNIEELLLHIGIQEGDTSARANVNNGNLNLFLQLEQDGAFNEDGTFDPLPYCDDVHNDRLIGVDQSGNPFQQSVKIIIVDQIISGIENIDLITGGGTQGGDHGDKVYSVINNILSQAGITDVEYLNLVAFDEQGTGTVGTLLKLAIFLRDQFESGNWDEQDRIIVNFSANLITYRVYNKLQVL